MTNVRFAEIEGHRPYLMRYALAQLRDGQLAEEAVQEALVAALESLGTFGGKSTLRTCLTSILRFKVADLQRRAVSERNHVAAHLPRGELVWQVSSLPPGPSIAARRRSSCRPPTSASFPRPSRRR